MKDRDQAEQRCLQAIQRDFRFDLKIVFAAKSDDAVKHDRKINLTQALFEIRRQKDSELIREVFFVDFARAVADGKNGLADFLGVLFA